MMRTGASAARMHHGPAVFADASPAAECLESSRPTPAEIDTRSPVRFEVCSAADEKAVRGAVIQVCAACNQSQLMLKQWRGFAVLFSVFCGCFPVLMRAGGTWW
jgi:hypothetical protein